MEESLKMESQLQSAAAFVEGGIQDACDDSCSICLEAFCESDPSTVTSCKHEFHLQCILEWCQRSSQCPMCWQPISLKDPISQELFEGVEHERNIRSNQTRNATIFRHPALGDFELQHLPVGVNDAELEERIIQHLAAAAAMGRAHHGGRREGQRRSTAQGRPQFLVFSTHPNAPSVGSVSLSSAPRGEEEQSSAAGNSSTIGNTTEGAVSVAQADPVSGMTSGTSAATNTNRPVISNSQISAGQTTPVGQDRAGPSDLQSFSETLKSRLNAVSMRYKDSITKSTRGWKERLFSRNTSVADIGSEVKREVTAGIASVSRMMERLDTRESRRTAGDHDQQSSGGYPVTQSSNERVADNKTNSPPNDNHTSTSSATTATLS
ncbi:uncharacterized protein A4U43_C01F33840 [Asparagus officinalis]|uniref:RING-type E3 ubiquitin transferase n=1 Tax=Asparagus officinalis TaxID=4686 RepID=A0A5P1FVR4_ASPOF|nr:E3 ubiquitin-protein ligase RHF2A-like [Asparagus officinalis]ONK81883.1 uncharacterized protein A4U43_C01F33840 [Asparagus officinalis]